MRKILQAIATGAILLGTSGLATATNIAGLDVSLGPTFGVAQIYQNVPTTLGDTLTGYGKVDSINSLAVGTLCVGCELTYKFGGYTVTSVSPTEIRFSGGWFNFYLGFGANNDFTTGNAGGSAGDLAEATNGILFLTLKGHAIDAAGNTLVGTGVNIGTLSPTGFASGLADVDTSGGGVANPYFDTNLLTALFGGNADLEIGASFSGLHPAYPGECPGGAACVRGSADFTGTVVPEPASVFLIGSGLLGLSLWQRRRRS